jgi:hypothetical protein
MINLCALVREREEQRWLSLFEANIAFDIPAAFSLLLA